MLFTLRICLAVCTFN